MLRRILFLFALCCASAVFAQVEPCATMKIYNEKLQKKEVESVEHFERWLAIKIQEGKAKGNGKGRTVITIPYVVHIINNGEALGTLSNISNTQINDQIAALNRDLRKANPDLANLPAAFQPLAADFEIEFCPAQVDPQGNILAEPGVNRVNRLTQGWTAPPHSDTYIDGTIKPATIWNPSNYFNMWVTQLGSGLLGYATFPSTTLLLGLNFPQYVGTATSDGIVVHYETFGNGNPGLLTNYTKGRVTAHEVGHWLGLRHIWGDASCGTDYCADTPTHGGSNFGCPTYPSISCGNNGDLSQNYMDYTNDDCKLMFSNDQKIRAVTIMNNSPFRLSLQTSSACSLPGLNVGVTNIVAPCTNGTSQTVTVTIKNKGITAIAAGDVSVNLTVSGGITGTYGAVMNTASLSTNGSTTLTFTNVDLSTTADIVLTAEATLVGDLYAPDDTYNVSTNLGSPLITSVIAATCPTVPFTISLTNPKPTATSTEWQVSADNVTFTTIANVTTNSLTTSQTDTMYYRCKTICGGNAYFSNVLQIDIDAPNNCYCTPSYSNGCGSGDMMTNVTVSNLSNTTACAAGAPYYTFYNNTTIPIVDRNQPSNYSISFGPDGNQYFAIWIDQNVDGVFSASEMVAQNTVNAGSNGTYTGTFSLPTGTYVGQTRMRVRGGNDSQLLATQSCGVSSSGWGETEDYLVEIIAPAFNVGVTAINPPCVGAANQNVGVTLKNKGASSIPIGAVTLDLNFSGGANGSATTISNTTLIPVNGTFTLTFTNVNLTTTGGNIVFDVNATLAGDGNLLDNVLSLSTDLDDPNISTATVLACSATAFSINLTNPKATTTAMQWEKSLNNVTFSAIAGATTSTLSASQTATTYYRCRITCSGSFYYSNVLQIDMNLPTNCYCTPTYTNGCSNGAAAITNVTVGNLSNPTTCSASPYFTFYNFLTIPQIDRYQPTPYSISLGSTSNQYFAIWIDQNADGIFAAAEMVAQNTVSIGSNGTYTGSFDIPVGTYVGQTRMRVRGGDLSMLSASQSCGTSNSNNGETEDYLIELITLPVNVAVTGMQLPCVGTTNQTVNVTIKNRGTTTIPIGAVALDLSFSGAANGTATTVNNTTTIPTNGTATLSFTNLNLTTTGGNIAFDANATLVNDGNASDNILSLISDLDAPIISSAVTMVCSGVPFDVTITNPKPTTTAVQWEKSLNNVTFSAIAGATTSTLSASQTATTYYRCRITCSGSFYYSNVLQIDMDLPTNCYCTPTYSSGCGSGGDAMTNVSVGTLTNPSGCPTIPYYTFYNNLAIPQLDINQSHSYSISFGPDGNQYFAIWIDRNVDGIFDASEMVAQNTVNAGGNGTYTGTFNIPAGTYVGQTRMRVRGGDDSALSASQSCGTSNSSWGETEDYLVEIITIPINVGITKITPSCTTGLNELVSVTIKNKGTNTIAIGAAAVDLNVGGAGSSTYPAISNTTVIQVNGTETLTFTNVDLSNTGTYSFDANATLTGDGNLLDNILSLNANLDVPDISTNVNIVCSGTTFSLSLTNPKTTTTAVQWQKSTDNITFTNITGATNNTLTTSQVAAMYYRCQVTCSGSNYPSNSIQITMDLPTNCYCTPSYSSGCGSGGDAMTNVTVGTLSNTSGCPANPYYTFYNTLAIPVIDRTQTTNYSISFGPDPNQYFAIWIDQNVDGIFDAAEMVAQNTVNAGGNGTYTGTFVLSSSAYVGQTRMRVRGGDDSSLSATQSCGTSNSSYGETEDYLIDITAPAINVAVSSITKPCIASANQTVEVIIQNKGTADIAIGNLSLDLNLSGGVSGTYSAANTSLIPALSTAAVAIPNVNLNTNADVTFDVNAVIQGDSDPSDNTATTTTNLSPPVISTATIDACSGTPFTLSLTNNRPTFSAIQWEVSLNNVTFNNVTGGNFINLSATQTATSYYRCKVVCGGNSYTSNVIQVGMAAPLTCYCTPTYTSGCNFGNSINNVTIGTLDNTTGCTTNTYPYYTYYNNVTVPSLDRYQSIDYSINFGNVNRYYAIWIDLNQDAVFTFNEMVANNTTVNNSSIYYGTFNLPTGTLLGQTRMRIRGGDQSVISANQSCGNSNSAFGETEDYIVNITEVPVNIGVNNITLPCTGTTNQTVTVLVKNKGANPVPVGNLAIDLQVAGGITGTYTASNTSIIPVAGTSSVTITNVNLNTNADITVTANATIAGDANLTDNTFNLAANIATPVISANNSGACSGVYFILSLTNARPSFSSLQWESSSNNVTFTNIVGATTASLNTLQTALTYYRCKVTCGTSVYYSNTLTMSMLPVNSCYCTPTYSVGCNFGDEITNVTYGTMTNASSCSPTAYSYFNTLPVPTIVRGAAKNFSISFGSDASNYFAVWIDMNHDGVFATTEMYLNNTTPIGANGTYNGTITVPLGTYVGQTRMRIRGGNNAIVLNTQPCAASSSVYGETEDYMINLESPCTTPAIGTVNTITDVSARTPLGCIGCTGPYLIEYGAAGFTPGIGTTPGVGGSIFTTPVLNQTLTGLQPGITYDVYARQACSNNSAKKTFTTTCTSNTLPYNDGFNVGVLSSCWQNNVITAGTVAPTLTVVPTSTFPTTNAVEGTHMIKFNSHFATAGAQSRLVSKVLNTTGVNKVDVSFQMYEDNELISAEDKVKVQYSLNGTTWTDVEELIRPNAGLATGNWYNRTFTLPIAAGNVTTLRIGLLFTSALGNNIYIDNFKAYASPIFANFNADTCATIVVNNVSGKNNFRFRNANSLVAEINPNGNNLGTVTLLMKENLAGSVNVPSTNSGLKYMPRYFDLKSNATTPFPQNATLRFLFHDDELTDLNAATNGNETISSLLIKKYKEPNGGSSSENCITSDNILPSVTVSGVVATAVPEGFMLAIQANEFGEFGGFPNVILAPKIQAKVLLNNADVTSGIMTPGLPIVPNFPLSDPYSVAPWNTVFTHVAAGPTAATTSTILNVTGNNAIIDWVFLELRTGFSGASTVAYTRAALLQADGDVVDTDGTSVVAFPNAVAGNYFVAIRHRNHLGFRTENPIAVSATTPMLDFTNGSQLLYGISPLVAISATLNAMNGGDANMDGSIDSVDSTIWETENGSFDDYLFNSDYNADGSVDGSDSAIWQINNGKYQELD